MARIRTIKPEFFTSEDIVALSPMARLLYIALWCEADREGRMAWKPATFKLRYFPGDNCDIHALCDELVKAKLVILYGEGYAYVPAFKKHQHINPREAGSSLPAPEEVDACARVNDASPRVSDTQGGKERKGNIETRQHASGYPEDFERFWKAYPCHKAKQDALKAWLKLKPSEELQASILKAIEIQRQGEDWRKEGGRFVPHASTWLNGRRWLDEVTSSPQPGRLQLIGGV